MLVRCFSVEIEALATSIYSNNQFETSKIKFVNSRNLNEMAVFQMLYTSQIGIREAS